MESEKPHRSTGNNSSSSSTSELFICFTSRLSASSSMKLSSKSILSPGRSREPSQLSLSASLSRRLRSNGSMKGGQASPMFPTGGKKRGCAFENPEPSSPKVTCIGQVRVKTKKQGKKIRTRSKRRGGEASFRRAEQQNMSVVTHQDLNMNIQNNPNGQEHRNQRWVHLPITICEALRAFGAEFNCFLPCRSSCMTGEREKEEKAAARSDGGENGNGNGSSCGAAFARWLVAMQESEGKGREMELVVGEEDQRVTERSHSLRRMEIFDEGNEIKEERNEDLEEEETRVSLCIPPKNALLLMRCRSDPVKMAALANRFWESPVHNVEDEDDDQDEDEDEDQRDEKEEQANVEVGEERQRELGVETEDEICGSDGEEHGHPEVEANLVMEEQDEDVEENPEQSPEVTDELQEHLVEQEEDEEEEMNPEVPAEETPLSCSSPEALVDPENSEMEQSIPKLVQENEHILEDKPEAQYNEEQEAEDFKEARFSSSSLVSVQSEQETEGEEEEDEEEEANSGALGEEAEEKETPERPREDEETATHQISEPEYPKYNEWDPGLEPKIRKSEVKPERDSSVLPDCLLLMMCEPKLSMEVSRETWVCSTDFIRCLPERPVSKTNGGDEVKKRVSTEDSNPTQPAHQFLQPPRSSCSFPLAAAANAGAGASMASMIEQKLVGAKGCEPFVLTRCKSEPMRSASKLAPENCFWKNRKLEPHRPGTLGMGAAGVGF
ncbi:uncharacterized protein LOC132176023 [Corylus avellana]|uniref:uncharacterized protein LOC132176023 n=1 Tax=Corylus avellana TaxID=13451 RepID=UPI001E217FE8|nr:uncharacterized protein LOC132176023 [Corylus avellana]